MDADGDVRTAVQLTNGQLDGPAGIAPLPDGRIGYISRVGEDLTLWVMNADGSDQHQIGLQMPFVEELRATPDGRFFIFSARRNGFSHLYRIDTNGQDLRQLTDGESYEISSTISPDSDWVYYIAKSVVTAIIRRPIYENLDRRQPNGQCERDGTRLGTRTIARWKIDRRT